MPRIAPLSTRINFISLVLLFVLNKCVFLLAQTVGPDTVIRNSTTTGSAMEASAAFEQGVTYVAWRDTRDEASSGGGDIYVQKLGLDGQALWAANGLAICLAPNTQSLPAITPDGTGGAVVAWLDDRTNPKAIYAQRISASGTGQWAANGVLVGTVYVEAPFSFVHRAPNGAFLVTWWDSDPLSNTDFFPVLAQKLDANGTPLWDAAPPDNQDLWGPGIEVIDGITRGRSAPDGSGGFIALGKIHDGGFRFQRILADDSRAWPNPVDFEASLPDTVSFNFSADDTGGVIVAFLDNRDVRAFRVAGDGTFPWGKSGVTLVQQNVLTGQLPFVAPNGSGGAFVAWIASTPHDVRVQQIAADGSILWVAGGAIVPDGSSSEREPAMVSDGAGGIFLSFTTATSLRGQRLDGNGAAQWRVGGSNGVGLGTGDLPIIGAGLSGPIVVHERGTALFAKMIGVATPFQLTSIVGLSDNRVSLGLSGGVSGRTYDVLRAAALVPPNNAWTPVGTLQSGQTWIDANPLSPGAFYRARDAAP